MKKKRICLVLILIVSVLILTGCLLDNGSVTYESHPNKIKYEITYGYDIDCQGNGKYNIFYNCDIPDQILNTMVLSYELLHSNGYRQDTVEENGIISWNINGTSYNTYKLGITAEILAESFLISDLNGNNALTLDKIKTDHPEIYNKYTKKQSVDGVDYIDPYNPNIKENATEVLKDNGSGNSFIAAKKLFIWLKENTDYIPHLVNNDVQPADETCKLGSGDCDDLSFLYISLCRSVGLPARFIRGYLVEESSTVAHAWVEVFVGGKNIGNNGWIPVECAGISDDVNSEVNQNFGRERAGHLRLFQDAGTNESLNLSISGPHVKYDKGVNIDMTSFVDVKNYEVLESKELYVDQNGNRKHT